MEVLKKALSKENLAYYDNKAKKLQVKDIELNGNNLKVVKRDNTSKTLELPAVDLTDYAKKSDIPTIPDIPDISGLQPKLIAGDNITITNNVISAISSESIEVKDIETITNDDIDEVCV